MEVLRGLDASSEVTGSSAVTIGSFDGVHRGHQMVIRRTVEVAAGRGLRSVAVTFDPHPREILSPGQAPALLTTLERKSRLIGELGIELLVVLPFDEMLSRWSPERFVSKILIDGLECRHAVVGSNFTFGHKGAGNLQVLTDLGTVNGFSVEGMTLLGVEDRPVSSSAIRDALGAGDLEWATAALGRRFVVDGRVVEGAGRGTGLGWPTANLEVPPGMLLPAEGVYAGRAHVADGLHLAAINIGTNPTFGGEPLHAEAFLLDFEGQLRGQSIALEFWARLRDEVQFESPEDLARQIGDDVERTRQLVG